MAEAVELANRLRLPLYEVSVKNDLNVNQVFHYLAEKYIEEINGKLLLELGSISSTITIFFDTSRRGNRFKSGYSYNVHLYPFTVYMKRNCNSGFENGKDKERKAN